MFPGVGAFLMPYLILNQTNDLIFPSISVINVFTFIFGLACLFCLIRCIWGFAFYGKGTLAPIDPPKTLVVYGPYNYTRNPMYLSVIGILVSETILFKSIYLPIYMLILFSMFHIFITFYEEPKLRELFGESYERYFQSVPRWWINLKPYKLGGLKEEKK